jgi:hypothetical protein
MKNLITSLRIALLAGAIFSSNASAQSLPSVPETPEAWKQAARNDIEAAFLETKIIIREWQIRKIPDFLHG